MKRITVVLACAAALACLLIPAVATAAFTTNDACLACHEPAGSGAFTKVDFATYVSQGDVDYKACNACHNAKLTDYIGGFSHDHYLYGLNCAGCHRFVPSYGVADPTRVQAVLISGSGYFNSAESVLASPAELHDIHVNGSWPKDTRYMDYICAGCHAPAACSSCHVGAVPHGTHSSTGYSPVTYTVAYGQLPSAMAANTRSETISCVNASCHSLVAASAPEFVPFCGDGCHIPPADTDRTQPHGYESFNHTATVSAVIDPGEVEPCGSCHSMDLMTEHARSSASGSRDCGVCHPSPENTILGPWDSTCQTFGCHAPASSTAKHGDIASAHATVTISASLDCYSCHKGDLAVVHAKHEDSCLVCHGTDTMPTTRDCTVCHTSYHAQQDAKHGGLSATCSEAPGCHPSTMLPEIHELYVGAGTNNADYATTCDLCHNNSAVDVTTGACDSCHEYPGGNPHGDMSHVADSTASKDCEACHSAELADAIKMRVEFIHGADVNTPEQRAKCAICHNNATKGNITWNLTDSECVNCHKVSGTDFHQEVEEKHEAAVVPGCVGECHDTSLTAEHQEAKDTVDGVEVTGCFVCHNASQALTGATCETCHFTFDDHYDSVVHTSPWAPGAACAGAGCHVADDGDLKNVHNNFRTFGCVECHGSAVRQAVKDAIEAGRTNCDACHEGASPTGGHTAVHFAEPPLKNDNGTGNYAYYTGTTSGTPVPDCATCHRVNLIDEHLGVRKADGSYDSYPKTDSTGAALTCQSCHRDDAPISVHLAILAGATNCDACHTVHGPIPAVHTSTYETDPKVPCADCHRVVVNGTALTTLDMVHPATVTTPGGVTLQGCQVCHGYFEGEFGAKVQNAIGVTNDTRCTACHTGYHTPLGPPHTTAETTVGGVDCAGCHDEDTVAGVDVLPVHAGSVKGACAVCHANPSRVADITAKTPACASCHSAAGEDFHRDFGTKHTYTGMGTDCQAAGCHSNDLDVEHTKYLSRYPAYADSCALCHRNSDTGRIDWDTATAACSSCHEGGHPEHIANESGLCLGSGCHAASGDLLPMHADSEHGACAVCHGGATRPDVTAGKTLFDCAQSGCHQGFSIQSHPNLTAAHQATTTASKDCGKCHQREATTSVDIDLVHRTTSGTCALSLCHRNETRIGDWSKITAECASCHKTDTFHDEQDAKHTYTGMGADCQAAGCHSKMLPTEHDKYLSRYPSYATSCLLCHANSDADRIDWDTATAACSSCHTATHPPHLATSSPTCVACHGTNDALPLHRNRPEGQCAVCHNHPTKGDLTSGKTTFECAQSGCHANRYPEDPNHYSDTPHTASPFTSFFQRSTFDAGGKECSTCHSSTLRAAHATTSTSGGSVTCIECHTDTRLNSKAVVAADWPTKQCVACHDHAAPKTHATYGTAHVVPAGSCAGTGTGCHNSTDLAKLHDKSVAGGAPSYESCWNAACHDTKNERPAAIKTTNSCGSSDSSCHSTGDYHPAHIANNSPACFESGCHVVSPARDLFPLHENRPEGQCAVCHAHPTRGDLTSGKTTFDCAQSGCHPSGTDPHPPHIAKSSNSCLGAGCHRTATVGDVMQIHVESEHGRCAVCHGGGGMPDVTTGKTTFECAQSGCHADVTGDHHASHNSHGKVDPGCYGCHFQYIDDEHAKLGYTCGTCHDSTNAAVKAAISGKDVRCSACHPAVNGKNRHAAQNTMEFIPGNSSGHRVDASLPWAKTSFLVNGTTYTWPLPSTSTFLKSPWTPTSIVTCKDCHNFGTDPAGPHGSAVTVRMDPAYPRDWQSARLGSKTSYGDYKTGPNAPAYTGGYNGPTTGAVICNKCHNTNYTSMNEVHDDGHHNGALCVDCHTQMPHGWRLPRLLAYTTDPSPYASRRLGALQLRSYTPTGNWDESDCYAGCDDHESSVSRVWPSVVQAPAGTLTGTVKSSTGAAISGATVAVTGQGSATTGSTGAYTLSLPAGTYTVTASATGYTAQSFTVTITSKLTTTQNFALTVAPVSSNIALGKTFTASRSSSSYPPSNAGDGSTSTRWSTGSLSSGWQTQWLQVDLGSAQSINKAVVYWYSSDYARDYRVQVSTDGTTWTDVATVTGGSSGTRTHSFTTRSARYVRVYCTRYNQSSGYAVTELQVWTP